MWVAVTKRFSTFHDELRLTQPQKDTGQTHHRGIRKKLNQHYYDSDSETANSFLVGSWGKFTRIRPPRDIDLFFVLPIEVYNRFNNRTGNIQSQLLNEIKSVLDKSYIATNIRGDGQVVVVGFNSMSVEVVPAFELTTGQYYICDTHYDGSYKTVDPNSEKNAIQTNNDNNSGNLRPLIRMLKCWQGHCNVPIKSFLIELIMTEYINQYEWRNCSYFYYDWFCRDFFEFLIKKANSNVFVPGTAEVINLKADWKTKAETAYARAIRACNHERDDNVELAGEEWQKIFGNQILKNP